MRFVSSVLTKLQAKTWGTEQHWSDRVLGYTKSTAQYWPVTQTTVHKHEQCGVSNLQNHAI